MSTKPLTLVEQPESPRRGRRGLTRDTVMNMNVVDQMKRAFSHGHRLSAAMGMILGGFVPVAVYCLVHYEVAAHPSFWTMIAGGLLYSAISVCLWAKQAFGLWIKTLGFVLLVEGTVTFSHEVWLSLSGLIILVVINGLSAAVSLQVRE